MLVVINFLKTKENQELKINLDCCRSMITGYDVRDQKVKKLKDKLRKAEEHGDALCDHIVSLTKIVLPLKDYLPKGIYEWVLGLDALQQGDSQC